MLVMLFVAMPSSFPYKVDPSTPKTRSFSPALIRSLDFPGAFLILAASVLLVTAVQEGGAEYPWRSAVVLGTLCVSAVSWVMFFWWQRRASMEQNVGDPVLPWHLLTNRFTMGFIL